MCFQFLMFWIYWDEVKCIFQIYWCLYQPFSFGLVYSNCQRILIEKKYYNVSAKSLPMSVLYGTHINVRNFISLHFGAEVNLYIVFKHILHTYVSLVLPNFLLVLPSHWWHKFLSYAHKILCNIYEKTFTLKVYKKIRRAWIQSAIVCLKQEAFLVL